MSWYAAVANVGVPAALLLQARMTSNASVPDDATWGRTGLIALVGEQLSWDLDALGHWGGQLQRVVLVGTRRDWEPGGPGARLTTFIGRNVPQAAVEVVVVRAHSPVDVSAAITSTMENGSDGWLVSLAGGTRLMFAGGWAAAAGHPRATVIYRDERMQWHFLLCDGTRRPIEGLDPRATDRFSVADLLAATWGDRKLGVVARQGHVEPEIARAAERAVEGAPWRKEFELAVATVRKRVGERRGSAQAGSLFENFVLATVRLLGVHADDVLVGTKLASEGSAVQEVDVVVNSSGRLHVVDCKLTSLRQAEVPVGSQIREAATTKFHLGDGATQMILLRPNWILPPAFRELIRTLHLRVVDRTDLTRENLPAILGRLLDAPTR